MEARTHAVVTRESHDGAENPGAKSLELIDRERQACNFIALLWSSVQSCHISFPLVKDT